MLNNSKKFKKNKERGIQENNEKLEIRKSEN